jgi:hypothetical protein
MLANMRVWDVIEFCLCWSEYKYHLIPSCAQQTFMEYQALGTGFHLSVKKPLVSCKLARDFPLGEVWDDDGDGDGGGDDEGSGGNNEAIVFVSSVQQGLSSCPFYEGGYYYFPSCWGVN